MIDADRDWQTRQESLAVERAMALRERRQADLMTILVEAGGTALMVALFVWGLSVAHDAGLFSFLEAL